MRREKLHNVKILGARSAAAFDSLVDHSRTRRLIASSLEHATYVTRDEVDAYRMMGTQIGQRTYDRGHRTSVDAVRALRTGIRAKLASHFGVPGFPTALVLEASSKASPWLQASDIAAGLARHLYETQGVRAVSQEFRSVIHNGTMVRL